MKKALRFALPALIILLLTNGCIGFGMYESPEIVGNGESRVGLGTPFLWWSNSRFLIFPFPEIYYRRGLGNKSEILINSPLFVHAENSWFLMESGKLRKSFFHNDIFSLQFGGAFSDNNTPVLWVGPGAFIRDSRMQKIGGVQYLFFTTPFTDENIFPGTSFLRFYFGNRFPGNYGPQLGFQLIISSSRDVLGVVEMNLEFNLSGGIL